MAHVATGHPILHRVGMNHIICMVQVVTNLPDTEDLAFVQCIWNPISSHFPTLRLNTFVLPTGIQMAMGSCVSKRRQR